MSTVGHVLFVLGATFMLGGLVGSIFHKVAEFYGGLFVLGVALFVVALLLA